jgi:hypothetical protein
MMKLGHGASNTVKHSRSKSSTQRTPQNYALVGKHRVGISLLLLGLVFGIVGGMMNSWGPAFIVFSILSITVCGSPFIYRPSLYSTFDFGDGKWFLQVVALSFLTYAILGYGIAIFRNELSQTFNVQAVLTLVSTYTVVKLTFISCLALVSAIARIIEKQDY